MYKFFLYFVLTISYLGLAKALSPSEVGVQYVQNDKSFSKILKGSSVSVILVDTHSTGFLIKTYYQKYRVITDYDNIEEMIVRTSREYAKKNLKNIGLSLYRRLENKEENLPLPPGSNYIGNAEYGEWRTSEKTGKTRWIFWKAYKDFPKYFGWGKWRPTEEFYREMRNAQSTNHPFYGTEDEFGINGRVTRENFPHFFRSERAKQINMKDLLIEYFKENF
ncbi:MAG: hypothetical protein ACJ76H_06790 [Bacteriovoracaceae bacterium]